MADIFLTDKDKEAIDSRIEGIENKVTGKQEKTGDSKDNTVTFDSKDGAAEEWTDVESMKSGEKHSSIFGKIATMFANILFLKKRTDKLYNFLEATLPAGETTVSFTDASISENSIIEGPYTSVYGLNPTAATVNGSTLIYTFDAQEIDITVKVRCF